MTAQIDLTQIVNIGNDIIDPQNLLCSLCCCIRLDLVQCKNNKCDKVYCEPCIKESNKFKDICPFCQLNVGYKRCDDKVYKILENLSLICQDNNCKETFTISKYFYHKKITNHKETTCIKCNNVELKLSKCYLCNNNYCSNCTNFISCFNCKSIICNTCNKNSNKGINNETLCGNCSRDCFLCKEESINICIFCQKSLCGKCSYHCKTCDSIMCLNTCYANKNYLNDCKICNGIINNNNMNNTYNNCIHKQLLSCNNCNKKCQRISKINCKELLASNTCSVCKFEVCNKNCSLKCKSCKDIYCKTCSGFCAICKTSYCDSCVLKCYNCEEFNSSCCKNCKPDIFKNCLTCNKLLCINCWNLCNYCNAIFCKIHIEKCLDCQESCCKEHFYTCKVCNNKEDKYKKHCLHKCTLKCDFCDVISSINCNKSKHSIVTKFNCGHNVCSECVKKCGKCKTIVMSCRKCINNYYFISCKNCDIYLCSSCSKSCKNCNELYCCYNKCKECNKLVQNVCLDCNECKFCEFCKCDERIQQCEICKNLIFCNNKCRNNYKTKNKLNHLCLKCNYCNEKIENPNKNRKKKIKAHKYNEVNTSSASIKQKDKSDKREIIEVKKVTCKDKLNSCVIF